MIEYVFPADMLRSLRSELLRHAPDEAGAIVLAGVSRCSGRTRLLARELLFVPDTHYEVKEPLRLVISASFIAPLLKRAREEGWRMIVAHSHPFAEESVRFSDVDDRGEAILMPSLFARAADGPHGTLVVGPSRFDARVWRSDRGPVESVHRMVNCGASLTADLRAEATDSTALTVDVDRHVRAFGKRGQQHLQETRFAIVGVGGLGSHVAQQLAYLGARRVLLLDPDPIEATNLNRLVGATPQDVGLAKVDVVAAKMRQIREGIDVMPVRGDVTRQADSAQLLNSDLIFCCTDTHGSRAVLNQLAYQHYIPVIDMGVRIDAPNSVIEDISGRVQMLSPGLACLACNDFLNSEQVRRDLLSPEERARDQYIVGAEEPQPSVVSLNGQVASMAVSMMLSVVAGAPLEARYQVLLGTRGLVRAVAATSNENCVICSRRGALGRGDLLRLPGRP